MAKISVIIPIYKAEKYLHRCLVSIQKQTFRDFEVLLIDDGSPDESGKICDYYSNSDSRFRTFHIENRGVAGARQLGVDNAKGEYSIHIDPDDWIEPETFQLIYEEAISKNSDIVVFDFIEEYGEKSKEIRHDYHEKRKELLLDLYLSLQYHCSCCNKLIRHNLYKRYSVSFPLNLTRWEDVYVVCQFMAKDDISVSFVHKVLYHYDLHTNNNSLVRFANIKTLNSQIYVTDFFCKLFKGTIHEKSLSSMKMATKDLAYDLLAPKEYINLYRELNKDIVKNSFRGYWGFGGVFRTLTILTKSRLPHSLYLKLHQLRK